MASKSLRLRIAKKLGIKPSRLKQRCMLCGREIRKSMAIICSQCARQELRAKAKRNSLRRK